MTHIGKSFGERVSGSWRALGALAGAGVFAAGFSLPAAQAPAQSAQDLIDGADWFERPLAQGVTWRYYHFDNLFGARQNINIVEIDLDDPDVEFHIPYRVPPPDPSYQRLHQMIADQVPDAVAAVNGSRYAISGDGSPAAFLRSGGNTIIPEAVSSGSFWLQGAFGVLGDGKGAVLVERPSTDDGWEDAPATYVDLLASGPNLVVEGNPSTNLPTGGHCSRHPRTIQILTTDNRLLMVTADGRQDMAAGLNCDEMVELSQALGAYNAVSFDGGGSTTMVVPQEPGFQGTGVVNWFSDSGIRAVADGVAVTGAPADSVEWDGRISNVAYPTLVRSFDDVTVTATYENIGTETWTADNVSVVPSRPFGRTSDFVPADEEETFFTMDPPTVAPGETATVTLNLVAPEVESDTNAVETFALWHETEGFFGPADNELRLQTVVRPEIDGAPPIMIVQGTADGSNNQWYHEPTTGWFSSTVGFTAEGVANEGQQRGCWATGTGRYAEFTPIFDVTGIYKVEVAFPHSTNSISSVQYTVNHLDGSDSTTLNQNSSALANQWNNIGEFPFSDGSTKDQGVHSVRVGNANVTGDRFYSGAVRFDYVGPLEPTQVGEWSLY